MTDIRVSYLATQGEQGPEASMAPFALYRGDVLIHLSQLARHTLNIERHPRVGIMICTPETSTESPLALPRVSLTGEVASVAQQELSAARTDYLKRIPEAGPLFDFPDFRLFRVRVDEARWVGGFGKAHTLSAHGWYGLFSES